MLSTQIKRDRFVIKDRYPYTVLNFEYPEEITTGHFIDLYDFAEKHIKGFSEMLIEKYSTLDGAIVYISNIIKKKLGNDVTIFPSGVYVGTNVPTKYDIYAGYLKPVFEVRKNPELFKFMLKIFGNIKARGINVFNGPNFGIAYEQLMEHEEPEIGEYLALKHYDKIIEPFLKLIPRKYQKISDKELKYMCGKYPLYRKFFKNAELFFRTEVCLGHLIPMNLTEDHLNDCYIDLDERFFCFWNDRDDWFTIDGTIGSNRQFQYENNECGEVYATINISKGEGFDLLKERITGAKRLLKLFGTYYEFNS